MQNLPVEIVDEAEPPAPTENWAKGVEEATPNCVEFIVKELAVARLVRVVKSGKVVVEISILSLLRFVKLVLITARLSLSVSEPAMVVMVEPKKSSFFRGSILPIGQ